MYKKVELKDGFVGMEHKVAENWKEKDILLFMMDHQQQMVNHMLDILKQE